MPMIQLIYDIPDNQSMGLGWQDLVMVRKRLEAMEAIEISKSLGNETRMNILHWLKEPDIHFPAPRTCGLEDWHQGVCVQVIQEKAGVSQSVCSGYLAAMQRAGLLNSQRSGKWTYYKRNEETIKEFAAFLQQEL